jgi:hypothetical protein
VIKKLCEVAAFLAICTRESGEAVRFPRFPGGSRSWSDWAKGGAEL